MERERAGTSEFRMHIEALNRDFPAFRIGMSPFDKLRAGFLTRLRALPGYGGQASAPLDFG